MNDLEKIDLATAIALLNEREDSEFADELEVTYSAGEDIELYDLFPMVPSSRHPTGGIALVSSPTRGRTGYVILRLGFDTAYPNTFQRNLSFIPEDSGFADVGIGSRPAYYIRRAVRELISDEVPPGWTLSTPSGEVEG